MAKVNAAQWLDKWGRRLSAAGPDIQAGVQRVQTAPGIAAAAAQDRMLAALTAAVTSGVWASKVSKVSLPDWQNAMVNKGMPRIAAGVSTAQKTKTAQVTALLNAVDQSVASIAGLPKGGIDNSIARATGFMRAMSANAPKRQK